MRLVHSIFSVLSVVLLSACGNLSRVAADGTTDNPVWPGIKQSGFNHDGSQYGSWPDWDNVRMIEAGMNKDQISNLIGRPHFAEGIVGVREWDYVFNYRENGEHKVCQFKILFDKNRDAQSFFWLPEKCGPESSSQAETIITSVEPYELSGDFLFDFDSAGLSEQGKEQLTKIANKLKNQSVTRIKVEGFTDYLGNEDYNLRLSHQRAEAVKAYLVSQGILSDAIYAAGRGESVQIKFCEGGSGTSLRECLKPNRRVVISRY